MHCLVQGFIAWLAERDRKRQTLEKEIEILLEGDWYRLQIEKLSLSVSDG